MADFLGICKNCRGTCCKIGGTDFTRKEKDQVLRKGFPDYFRKISNNHYEARGKNGVCPYLKKDNSCLIHEVRPLLCRKWPIFTEVENGKKIHALIECPLTPHLSEKDINEMKDHAEKISASLIKRATSCSSIDEKEMDIIDKRFSKFKEKKLH